jgi:hypothetical protein
MTLNRILLGTCSFKALLFDAPTSSAATGKSGSLLSTLRPNKGNAVQ